MEVCQGGQWISEQHRRRLLSAGSVSEFILHGANEYLKKAVVFKLVCACAHVMRVLRY